MVAQTHDICFATENEPEVNGTNHSDPGCVARGSSDELDRTVKQHCADELMHNEEV